MEEKETEQPTQFKPLCVYCNEPWSDKMELVHDFITEGCDTCGFGKELVGSFIIKCSKCKRIVYKKEGRWDITE
jgi:hypothetical protein